VLRAAGAERTAEADAPEGEESGVTAGAELDASGYIFAEMVAGDVTPFLGAGANLLRLDPAFEWTPDQDEYLPSAAELADHLAASFEFPKSEARQLVRVAQLAHVAIGDDDLYQQLRAVFVRNYPPTALHRYLARLPKALQAKCHPTTYQLIVTTNYDDLLERAFAEEGEPYDLIFYRAEDGGRGGFVHRPPRGDDESGPVEVPIPQGSANDYDPDPPLLAERTTILKIHGAVDRKNAEEDSYVITEDDYISFLAHNDLSNLVPSALKARIVNDHLLFLGYSLRDWNLRAFLQRVWDERQRKRPKTSWAIQRDVDALEQFSWAKNNVQILHLDLADFVNELAERLARIPDLCPPASAATDA
jgi:hypothetical protein